MDDNGLSRRRLLRAGVVGAGGLAGAGVLAGCAGGGGKKAGDTGDTGTVSTGNESGGGETGGGASKPIRIGYAYPLTGAFSGDGLEAQRASTLAGDEANAGGGIFGRKIEQIFVDVEDYAPEKLQAAFTRLTSQENVDAIIAASPFAPGPDMEIAAQTKIPYLLHSAQSPYSDAVKKDPEKYAHVINAVPWEFPHGKGFIPVLKQIEASGAWKPRNKKIFIVGANNAYSTNIAKAMRDAIRKEGWTVAGFEQVVTPFTDWGPMLRKMIAADPDVIFHTDYVVGDMVAFQKRFVQNPTKSLIYHQYAPSIPEYLKLGGTAVNGVLWAGTRGILEDPIGRAYAARYQKRWKRPPGAAFGAINYDTTNTYLEAVRRANGPEDRDRVVREILGIAYRGVCGALSYRQDDHTMKSYPTEEADLSLGSPHLYYQIQDGVHKMLSPETYATGKFQLPPWF